MHLICMQFIHFALPLFHEAGAPDGLQVVFTVCRR